MKESFHKAPNKAELRGSRLSAAEISGSGRLGPADLVQMGLDNRPKWFHLLRRRFLPRPFSAGRFSDWERGDLSGMKGSSVCPEVPVYQSV